MALPVLFLTTTRPLIEDPAVMVREGRTTRAESACGLPDCCGTWPALEQPAARIVSRMTNSFMSIRRYLLQSGLCRFHHQIKQLSGWQLVQQEPGTFAWVTPSGRTYYIEPGRHAA
jgi:hypothetical protein